MLIKTANYGTNDQGGLLAPHAGGPVGCAPEQGSEPLAAPEHCSSSSRPTGASLGQGMQLYRYSVVCRTLYRYSVFQFSALRRPRAAIGGTIWPWCATGPPLCQWAGSQSQGWPKIACVPKFASRTECTAAALPYRSACLWPVIVARWSY